MSTEHGIAKLGGAGILTASDLEDLGAGKRRVYELMKDGRYHRPDEIKLAAGKSGKPASEGLRRMRELREWYIVDRRAVSDRLFEYRLRAPVEPEEIKEVEDYRDQVRAKPSNTEAKAAAKALIALYEASEANKHLFSPALRKVGKWLYKGAPR